MKSLIAFASASFIGLTIVSVAHAAADDTPRSRTVEFADLDLSKIEGAAALFVRIRGAAKSVCERGSGMDLVRQQRFADCVEHAMSHAIAQVDAPLLTEYFASRGASGQKPMRIASR